MSRKVRPEELGVAVRPAPPSHGLLRMADGAVRRLIPERWVIDLFLVGLAALIVGTAALGTLAVLSTGAPAAAPAAGGLTTCPRHTVTHVALDVCSDPACCQEVR